MNGAARDPLTVVVEPLDPVAVAPFGRVVDLPAGAPDAWGPGWRWWAETTVLPSDGRDGRGGHAADR